MQDSSWVLCNCKTHRDFLFPPPSGLLIILFILAFQTKYDQSAENGFYFAAVLDAMWLVVATGILISVQGKYSKITAPIIIHGDQGRKCGTWLRLFPSFPP